ncbi:uncharacterized protein LOC106385084 isoform X2 [Brassica napus]|uniref:uncharacterized protein LOC106385084 isoform X2 n=1 Tax=Brassica napus TaxID=3708 RepID=UPI0006AB56ED|nr:uncharacterized protein LOC106385084 isoform X2 [Brassica napus]XP_048602240.1 uncharacterized protein LOC106385084 isoform X2 [Brassica napus]
MAASISTRLICTVGSFAAVGRSSMNASEKFLSSPPCNLKVDVYITSIAYKASPNRSSLLAYTQISYWRQCPSRIRSATIVSFLKCSLCDCIYVESNLQMGADGVGEDSTSNFFLSYLKFHQGLQGPFLLLCPLSITDG